MRPGGGDGQFGHLGQLHERGTAVGLQYGEDALVGLIGHDRGVLSVRYALYPLYLLPERDGFPILPGNFSSFSYAFCYVVECLCLKF